MEFPSECKMLDLSGLDSPPCKPFDCSTIGWRAWFKSENKPVSKKLHSSRR